LLLLLLVAPIVDCSAAAAAAAAGPDAVTAAVRFAARHWLEPLLARAVLGRPAE